MKNKTSKALIIIASLIAVLSPLAAEKSVLRLLPNDLMGIDKIKVESKKTDMNARTSVTVKTGTEEGIKGKVSDWSISGGKLKIRPAGDIVITLLPDNDLTDLDIEILSGNIRVDGLGTLDEIETVCTTGTTTIRNTYAEDDIKATSTQGRIVIENAEAPEIELNSVSGSISFRGKADSLKASSLLGGIDIEAGTTPQIKLNTTHGEMLVRTENKKPEIEFDTIFGRYSGPESTKENADMKIKAHSLNSPLTVTII